MYHIILEKKVHGRDIVLGLGMSMRSVNPNFTLDYMSSCINDDDNIIITDLRFDNEYDWCTNHGVIILKIKTPKEDDCTHISERGFRDDMCDGVVINHKNEKFTSDLLTTINQIIKKKENT